MIAIFCSRLPLLCFLNLRLEYLDTSLRRNSSWLDSPFDSYQLCFVSTQVKEQMSWKFFFTFLFSLRVRDKFLKNCLLRPFLTWYLWGPLGMPTEEARPLLGGNDVLAVGKSRQLFFINIRRKYRKEPLWTRNKWQKGSNLNFYLIL